MNSPAAIRDFSEIYYLRNKPCILFFVMAFIALAFFLVPVHAAKAASGDEVFPSFGNGPVEVRIYASYFCAPCRFLEPELEPVLSELVEDDKIRATFVDVPLSRAIPYIHYFLYALNEDHGLENAFRVRHVLFDVAKERGGPDEILKAFEEEGIAHESFDLTGVFTKMNQYLKEDAIRSTPSAVIRTETESTLYTGGGSILEALEAIKANDAATENGEDA